MKPRSWENEERARTMAGAAASMNEPALVQTRRRHPKRRHRSGPHNNLEMYGGITKDTLPSIPRFGANSRAALLGEALMDSFHERELKSNSLEGEPSLRILYKSPYTAQGMESEPQQISKLKRWYSTRTEGAHYDNHIKQEGERDDEWLQLSGSDISTEVPGSDDDNFATNDPNMSRSDKMMKEVALYFKILQWTGRMPFEQKKCRTFTKFSVNIACWDCRIYCATSILMTLLGAVMVRNIFEIVTQPANSAYRKVEELEFDKYWIFSLFVLFYLWHVVITSLFMIFQGSFYTGEFLTRWNICINILNYDSCYNLKFITRRGLIGTTVYALILICAMLVDGPFMDWNNCFGFISTLVLRGFILHFRISKHYGWLRWLGLFVHMYSIFASRLTTQMLLLYSQALENSARVYNIRLLGVLGTTSKVRETQSTVVFRRVIPYKKLFMEHLQLTTFSRQIGNVFAVRFLTSVLMQGLIVALSAYNVALLLHGYYSSKKFKDKEISGLQNVAIPIKYQMSLRTQGVILGVLVAFSISSFLHTSESLHRAGEELMKTVDHIRRFSLLQCIHSMERRFILTMQNSFNPKTDFYINCGFVVNRQFILAATAFLASSSLMLCDFSIQRLLNDEIVFCNDAGQCRKAVFKPATPGVSYPERGKMLFDPEPSNETTIPRSLEPEIASARMAALNETIRNTTTEDTTTPPEPITTSELTTTTTTTQKPIITTPTLTTTTPKPTTTTPEPTTTTPKPTTTTPEPTTTTPKPTITTPEPTTTTPKPTITTPEPTTTTPKPTTTTPKPTTTTTKPTTTTPEPTTTTPKPTTTTPKPTTTTTKPYDFENEFQKFFLYKCPGINKGTITRLRMILWSEKNKNMMATDNKAQGNKDMPKATWCEQDARPYSNTKKEFEEKNREKITSSGDGWKNLCYRRTRPPHNFEDDCGNVAVRLPNKETGKPVWPELQLTAIRLSPDVTTFYCCFQWHGYETQCGLAKRERDTSPEATKKYVEGRCKGRDARSSGEQCEDKSKKYEEKNVCYNFKEL